MRVEYGLLTPLHGNVQIGDQPVLPRREEKEYLVQRMRNEIQRSRGVVSAEGMAEYERALEFYQSLSVPGRLGTSRSDWPSFGTRS